MSLLFLEHLSTRLGHASRIRPAMRGIASIVSVDVAGESAKPVAGADGTRVPLLRPGFRPKGPYTVSFVYLHTGVPFARNGNMQMTLPRMDIPVGFITWELFMPGAYRVRMTGGNVIDQRGLDGTGLGEEPGEREIIGGGGGGAVPFGQTNGGASIASIADAPPNLVRGRVVDASGAVLPGVTVSFDAGSARRSTTTAADGTFVFSDVAPGPVTLTARLPGFSPQTLSFVATSAAQQVNFAIQVGSIVEAMTVSSALPRALDLDVQIQPPQNVVNLQRRAAGVLPVRIDVPRAGTSHRFVKPLLVDQEAVVMLRYKRR